MWSPYTTKVPTSGILDSAADMHNAPLESVKEVVGSMKIRTVTGTKEVPVGYQELPGFRSNAPAEVVGTTKHILSLPQAMREKRIVGFFQGDRVPDELPLGGGVLVEDVDADGNIRHIAIPVPSHDGVMQCPLDWEEARKCVKAGVIAKIMAKPDQLPKLHNDKRLAIMDQIDEVATSREQPSECHNVSHISVNEQYADNTFQWNTLYHKLQRSIERVIMKQ